MAELEGTLTTMEVVERTGLSRRTCLRELSVLLQQGSLVRHGKRRAACYGLPGGPGPVDLATRGEAAEGG